MGHMRSVRKFKSPERKEHKRIEVLWTVKNIFRKGGYRILNRVQEAMGPCVASGFT